jgi:23S rRNA A1618 N6-methylase RlmF
MSDFTFAASINIKPWCVKIETALEKYPQLQGYVEDGKLDFGNHESLIAYNQAVAYVLADLQIEVPSNHLIPAVCLRHAYMKIITEKYVSTNKKIIEIGAGASGIISLLAAKLYNHDIVATEINESSYLACIENIARNKLEHKINLIKSSGGILMDVIPYNSKFDALVTYPPTYAGSIQDEKKMDKKRGFKGVESEMIGGGLDGFEFTKNLISEACSPQFEIKVISILCLFDSHVMPSIELLQSNKRSVDVIELIAGTRKRYVVVGY